MSSSAIIILFAVGIVAFAWFLNWALHALFNKGERAIKNKMADKANAKPNQSENLADRFKNQNNNNQ